MKIRNICFGVCIPFVLMSLYSCASLSWQDLARGESAENEVVAGGSAIVILPTNENEKIQMRFKEYATRWWPDIPQVDDEDFIRQGALRDKALIVLGTKEGNRFLNRITGGIPMEVSAGGLLAREFHAGEAALRFSLKHSLYSRFPVFVLTGTSPAAILASEPAMKSQYDYLVLKGGEVKEAGYFGIAVPARPLKSRMFLDQLCLIVPENDSRLAPNAPWVIAEGAAKEEDFAGKSVVVWGTRQNNRVLDHLADLLPVKITDGRIVARGTHSGNDLILYAKVPSPEKNYTVRLLAGTGESALNDFNLFSPEFSLNNYDYLVIDRAAQAALECGLYPGNEGKYLLRANRLTPKESMLEDFDRLAQFLLDNLPVIEANKVVFGIDIPCVLERTRAQIRGDESPVEFFLLLKDMLMECQGDHLDLHLYDPGQRTDFYDITDGLPAGAPHQFSMFGKPAADLAKVHSVYRQSFVRDFLYTGPPLFYHEGDFYTTYDFSYDGQIYPRGMKLLSVNDRDMTAILTSLQPKLTKWDWRAGLFYGKLGRGYEGDAFWDLLATGSGDKLVMLFRKLDGEIAIIPYVFGDSLAPVGRKAFNRAAMPVREVAVLEQAGILYLRLPEMSDPDFYVRRIKALPQRNFRAVIIDIRFNLGGSSQTWMNILRELIAEPIVIPLKNARRNSLMINNIHAWPRRKETLPFLPGDYVIAAEQWAGISPATDSLHLTAPIYVLTKDIFSASGQLTQFAARSKQLISVGERNPVPLGSPGSPVFLYLPHSRIIVRFKLAVDIYDCRSAEDIFHTRPEVELNLSPAELLDYWNMDMSLPLEERLNRYDPYYRKVLEHLSASEQKTDN